MSIWGKRIDAWADSKYDRLHGTQGRHAAQDDEPPPVKLDRQTVTVIAKGVYGLALAAAMLLGAVALFMYGSM